MGKAALLFDGMTAMMKKLKKETYEERMKSFREAHEEYLKQMLEDPETLETVAAAFAQDVFEGHQVKGKIQGRTQAELNLFMVYYIFPAILLTEDEHADDLCQAIRTAWNRTFKNCNINYADYDRIYNSFRRKIFGIF